MSNHAVTLHKRKPVAIALIAALVLGLLAVLPMPARAETSNSGQGTSWTIPKSKVATWLEEGTTAQVTLQLPSAEAVLSSDIVFVVDNSSCKDDAIKGATATLDRLVAEAGGVDQVRVGVVSFKGDGHVEKELSTLAAGNVDSFKSAITSGYTGDMKSGTNMHDGLLKAKAMLDADTTTPANRKYVIMVSDGLTRLFTGADGNVKDIYYQYTYSDQSSQQPASDFNARDFVYYGMIDEWRQARTPGSATYAMPYGNWSDYYSHLVKWVKTDGDKYALDFATYGNDATLKVKDDATGAITDPNFAYIEHGTQADHAMAPDRAVYEAYSTWQALKGEGYNCYAVRTGSDSDFSVKFMDELNGGSELDFSQIADNILYACGTGSTITDAMGKGDTYDFDFVPGSAALSVGDERLEATDEGANTWSFHSKGDTKARFTLVYDPHADAYTLTTHEPISNFAPVKLTYNVTLAQAPTEPGSHELATNTKATLSPVNSNGVALTPEDFGVPSLAYAVEEPEPPAPDPGSGDEPNPDTKPAVEEPEPPAPDPGSGDESNPDTKPAVKRPATPSAEKVPQTGDAMSSLAFGAVALLGVGAVAIAVGAKVSKRR